MKKSIEENYLFYGVCFILLTLPLIYIPFIFNPYEFPKFLFFVGFSWILAFLYILKTVWETASLNKYEHVLMDSGQSRLSESFAKRLRMTGIDKITFLVLIYLAVVFLANILGLDSKISILGSEFRHQGFLTLLSGALIFFIVKKIKKIEDSFWMVIALNGFIVSALAICQIIAIQFFPQINIPTYQGRIVGSLGNPNSLGGYLVMLLPFVLFAEGSLRRHFIKYGISLLIIIAIFFTDSRSALLAGGFVIFVFLMKVFFKVNVCKKISLIILFLLVFLLFGNKMLNPIRRIFDSEVLQIRSESAKGLVQYDREWKRISIWDNRILIWAEGLKAFQKSPILGYGQENFELIFPKERHMKVDNAHNIFLEIAISSGMLGLIIFLAIIFIALKQSSIVVRLSIFVFLVVAQFNPLSIAQIAFFWFLISLSNRRDNNIV